MAIPIAGAIAPLIVERQRDQPADPTLATGQQNVPMAVMTRRWRLVGRALYDVQQDPGQKLNIAEQHPNVVGDLTEEYQAYFRDVFERDDRFTRFQLGDSSYNSTRMTVRDWHPTLGRVIWKQDQLGDDALFVNGFWAVHVEIPGQYSIRLSRHPDDDKRPMKASNARLEVGDIELYKELDPVDTEVVFEVTLPAGNTELQTWLKDVSTGRERGAYFVDVARADQ